MDELVGEPAESPQEPVAVEVVDGGLAEGELAQFLGALLDPGLTPRS